MEEIARGLVPYDMRAWNAAEAEPLILLPQERAARRLRNESVVRS
jgi:hypothetical protein